MFDSPSTVPQKDLLIQMLMSPAGAALGGVLGAIAGTWLTYVFKRRTKKETALREAYADMIACADELIDANTQYYAQFGQPSKDETITGTVSHKRYGVFDPSVERRFRASFFRVTLLERDAELGRLLHLFKAAVADDLDGPRDTDILAEKWREKLPNLNRQLMAITQRVRQRES